MPLIHLSTMKYYSGRDIATNFQHLRAQVIDKLVRAKASRHVSFLLLQAAPQKHI
jgi:hypothetical protein